jgi:hypothetical protein
MPEAAYSVHVYCIILPLSVLDLKPLLAAEIFLFIFFVLTLMMATLSK